MVGDAKMMGQLINGEKVRQDGSVAGWNPTVWMAKEKAVTYSTFPTASRE